MGHKVNPLVFRLGASNNWNYNLKENKNWITNYLVYKLVSNQFLHYTIPHFNREKTRNTRHDTGLVKMRGEKQIKTNKFIRRSMLLSHLLVGSFNNTLNISCFFFDYRLYFRNKSRKFARYSQLFSNVYFRFRVRKPISGKAKRQFMKKKPRKVLRWLSYLLPNIWFLNLNIYTFTKLESVTQLFKLNKIWLRLFDRVNNSSKKQKIFYFNVWSNLITSIIHVFKSIKLVNLVNRLYIVLLQINVINFEHKINNGLFSVNQFRTRYFLFKGVSKSINSNLKSMLPAMGDLCIKYHAIRERRMTSSLLTNLILVKLGQYYRINSILYPLTSWIKRHKNVLGFRIIVSGRLTRRERASLMIKSAKSMPLSSYEHKIDYNQDIKIMKFGMVGIKVYLFLRKKLRTSYYFFKFIFANGS